MPYRGTRARPADCRPGRDRYTCNTTLVAHAAGTPTPGSVGFDVRLLDDPAPALDVGLDHGAELLRRAACGSHAVGREKIGDVLGLERVVRRLVYALDHCAGQPLGADEAVPQHHLVARHARFAH